MVVLVEPLRRVMARRAGRSTGTRALAGVVLLLCLGESACARGSAPPDAEEERVALGFRYANDPSFRRAELEHSLVNPENGYSELRLTKYTEEDWGALPEWNPRVSPVSWQGATAPSPTDAVWTSLGVDDVPWEGPALHELGRRAFFEYPAQLADYLHHALASGDPADYGFWSEGDRMGGAVWVDLPSGVPETSLTCAACHASVSGATVIAGRNNPDIDVDRLSADYRAGVPTGWGPGRIDVTGDGVDNPTAIADLRAIRSQTRFHRAATVRAGLVPLAIRVETLIITSLGESVRPPRKLAFALALYLFHLEAVPLRAPDGASERGRALFAVDCAGCHRAPDYSGEPVAPSQVDTAPEVIGSPDRGTGAYRVPSLRGVGDRQRLFANGAVSDVSEILNPDRVAPGHRFGLERSQEEREAILQFLLTL